MESVYLLTPLNRPIRFGVYVYRYRGLIVDTGPAWTRVPAEGEAAILTHAHEDHAGGASRLGLPVYAGPMTATLLKTPPRLPPYRLLTWGPLRPANAQVAWQVGPLKALPTPGHAPDHLAWWDEERGLLFAGDLFLGVRANLALPGFDLEKLLESLKRVLDLRPRVLFCAHAGAVPAPEKALKAKIDFIEKTREEALRLKRQGLGPRAIRNRLFGGESLIGLLSFGEMSRLRFVQALIREG